MKDEIAEEMGQKIAAYLDGLVEQLLKRNGIDTAGITKENNQQWFTELTAQGWELKSEPVNSDPSEVIKKPDGGYSYCYKSKQQFVLYKNGVEVDRI